jgi:Endosomal/lysosomal potassium channel TMEM175
MVANQYTPADGRDSGRHARHRSKRTTVVVPPPVPELRALGFCPNFRCHTVIGKGEFDAHSDHHSWGLRSTGCLLWCPAAHWKQCRRRNGNSRQDVHLDLVCGCCGQYVDRCYTSGLFLYRRTPHLPVDLRVACGSGALDQVEVFLNTVGQVMGKGRLEAFGDGVLAIIITIMVLEMKVPHSENLEALLSLPPVFLRYVQSRRGSRVIH